MILIKSIRIFALLVTAIVLIAGMARGQNIQPRKWEKVGPITFTGMARQSPSRIVATTSHGYLYSTNDEGKTWDRKEIGDSLHLTAISFADSLHGMMLQNGGYYFLTTDGGAVWQKKKAPFALPFFVAYVSPDTAFIVNWIGNIYRSIDGGATWTKQFNVPGSDTVTSSGRFATRISFLDSKRGYVLGMEGMYVHTTDAGEHWDARDITNKQVPLLDVDFRGRDTAVIAGWGDYYITTDGGTNWADHPMSNDIYNGLNLVRFIDANSFFFFSDYNEQLYTSTDFGQTLNLSLMRQSNHLRYAVRTQTGWLAMGDAGTICKGTIIPESPGTVNWAILAECTAVANAAFHASNGKVLQAISSGDFPQYSNDSGIFWHVADTRYNGYSGFNFLAPDLGYLYNRSDLSVGMKTIDSGQSWQPVEMHSPILNGGITPISFGSGTVGFGLPSDPYTYRSVLATTDAGINWKLDSLLLPTYSPYPDCRVFSAVPEHVFALDPLHSFVTMRVEDSLIIQKGKSFYYGMKIHNVVYRTSDGGNSWSNLPNVPVVHTIHDMYFRNVFIGYLTCDSGRIYRTSDGGLSWAMHQLAPIHNNLSNINFLNDRIGFLSLDSQAVLETTDGGLNWKWLPIPTNREEVSMNMGQIIFPDSSTVLIAAARTMFQNIDPPLLLQDFGFYRSKIDLGTASVVEKQPRATALSLSIYPNPAHDIIHANISTPEHALAAIDILDILGRTVLQLRAETNTDFLIDTHTLPSGVYAMRCTWGSESQSESFSVVR